MTLGGNCIFLNPLTPLGCKSLHYVNRIYSSLSAFLTLVLQKTHLVPEEWRGYKWDAYLHFAWHNWHTAQGSRREIVFWDGLVSRGLWWASASLSENLRGIDWSQRVLLLLGFFCCWFGLGFFNFWKCKGRLTQLYFHSSLFLIKACLDQLDLWASVLMKNY